MVVGKSPNYVFFVKTSLKLVIVCDVQIIVKVNKIKGSHLPENKEGARD